MARFFIATALISFITLAVFGFAGMGHILTHSDCIAATAQGMMECTAKGEGALSEVLFHVDLYQHFSQALVQTFAVLALLLSAFIGGRYITPGVICALKACPLGVIFKTTSAVAKCAMRKLLRWFGMHELRDPQAVFGCIV